MADSHPSPVCRLRLRSSGWKACATRVDSKGCGTSTPSPCEGAHTQPCTESGRFAGRSNKCTPTLKLLPGTLAEADFLICTAPNPAEGVRPCRLARVERAANRGRTTQLRDCRWQVPPDRRSKSGNEVGRSRRAPPVRSADNEFGVSHRLFLQEVRNHSAARKRRPWPHATSS
jgi:hypothetical protein